MSVLLVTSCEGLHTQPNENGEIPPGACAVAENVQVSRDNTIECRRGFESAIDAPTAIQHLTPYAGTLMAQTASKVYQSDAGVTTLTEVASDTNAVAHPQGATPHGTFVYLTDSGVNAWEAGRTNTDTGVTPVPAPILTPVASGSMQAADTQVAYRAVRVRKPSASNPRTISSEPSGRVTVANATGAAQDVLVTVASTIFTTGYSLQVYRSLASATATTDPGDELGLIYERTTFPTASQLITGWSRTSNVVTVTMAGAHGYQPGDMVYSAGVSGFTGGDKVILSTPAANTWTYADTGVDTTSATAASAILAGIGFLDNVPDALVGASLYTNASQEGILQQNSRPPFVSGDVAEFRRCTFYGYARERQSYKLRVLAVGSPDGIQVGDTVVLTLVETGATVTLTAGSYEQNNVFVVATSGTPAENIAATAQSLARVVSRYPTNEYLGNYTSGPNDVPGSLVITRASSADGPFTVTLSRPGAFITFSKTTSEATTFKNRAYYSKVDQPEAVPALNFFDVGDAEASILRLAPLRDSLIVLKEDGVFRVTGDGPWNFRVDPFDLTIHCIAPNTAATLENTVVILTDQGVARISDTGVTILSRPIEDQILPLLVTDMVTAMDTYAFGVGYDSARKYILWVPLLPTDVNGEMAFVYDLFTETWTKWPMSARHAVVNPVDDKLYVAQGTTVLRERKDYASTDYQDAGGATIAAQLEWTPKFGDRPDMLHQFREVGLMCGSAEWTAADIGFATDLEPTMEYVSLPAVTSGQVVRVSVPRSKQRGSRLRVRFRQTQAGKAFQLKGLRVVYETTGERVRR